MLRRSGGGQPISGISALLKNGLGVDLAITADAVNYRAASGKALADTGQPVHPSLEFLQ